MHPVPNILGISLCCNWRRSSCILKQMCLLVWIVLIFSSGKAGLATTCCVAEREDVTFLDIIFLLLIAVLQLLLQIPDHNAQIKTVMKGLFMNAKIAINYFTSLKVPCCGISPVFVPTVVLWHSVMKCLSSMRTKQDTVLVLINCCATFC